MAALLPTILSDDEAEFSTTKSNPDAKKKRAKKKKVVSSEPKLKIDDSDDEGNSSNDEMDSDFEFGGVLVSSTLQIISLNCIIIWAADESRYSPVHITLFFDKHREKTELHSTH